MSIANNRRSLNAALTSVAVLLCFAAVSLGVENDETPAGQKWALLVGINDYQWLKDLEYCRRDAEELRDQLVRVGFPKDHVFLLYSGAEKIEDQPIKANIEHQLKVLLAMANEGDMVLVTFSGHGIHFSGRTYLCPREAREDDPTHTMISLNLFYDSLSECAASQKMFWVDACRDYGRSGSRTAAAKSVAGVARALTKPPEGVLVLASCKEGQLSWEDEQLKHGVFVHYLLEGLSGKADRESGDRNDHVSLLELYKYANVNTTRLVANRWNELQTPELFGRITGDFEIARVFGPDPLIVLRFARECLVKEAFAESGWGNPVTKLVQIAILQSSGGDKAAARSSFQLAVERAKSLSDRSGPHGTAVASDTAEEEARELNISHGLAAIAKGQALAGLIEEAVNTTTEIANVAYRAVALSEVAVAQAKQGDRQVAKATLASALRYAEAIKNEDAYYKSDALAHVAVGQAEAGDVVKAVTIAERIPDKSWVLAHIAGVQAATGDYDDAIRLAQTTQEGISKSEVLANIARYQARTGKKADAARTLRLAYRNAESMEFDRLEALLAVADVQVECGFTDDATKVVQRILREVPVVDGWQHMEPHDRAALIQSEMIEARAWAAVIQAKMRDRVGMLHTLDDAMGRLFNSEFPWAYGSPVVSPAQAELGQAEQALRTLRKCIATAGPGISADWPEVVRLLARHGAYSEAKKAIEVLKDWFPESTLQIELAKGILQARSHVEAEGFGTTKAFKSPMSIPRKGEP